MDPALWLVVSALLAVVGLGALVGPAYLRRFRRELSRADALRNAGRTLGLAFSRGDPAAPWNTAMRLPFELFSRGVEQHVENAVWGTYRGFPVVAFDFWWMERIAADDPSPSEPVARMDLSRTCAIVTFPGDTPYLRVSPAGTISKLERRAGVHDIELEWSDFNRIFDVVSSDPKFATEFLDPPMLAWLHDAGRTYTWEVQRGHVLCHAARIEPSALRAMLEVLVGVRERIPRGVQTIGGTADV